jgi:vacuolar protein sorting-associated protein VTA1
LRIAKALRNGEDPNLSNPVQEEPPVPPALSADDPEVRRINGLQPTVEDGNEHSRPPSFIDQPPSTARSPSIQTQGVPPQAPSQPDVSPMESSPPEGYFPNVPTFTSEQSAPSLPTAPEGSSAPDVVMTKPGLTAGPLSPPPDSFYNVQTPTTQPPAPSRAPSHPQIPSIASQQNNFPASPQHFAPTPGAPQVFIPSPHHATLQPPQVAPHPSIPIQQPQHTQAVHTMPGQYNRDDESILQAQKHAKWAISALNFEDVNTAVKELRIALRTLGAS